MPSYDRTLKTRVDHLQQAADTITAAGVSSDETGRDSPRASRLSAIISCHDLGTFTSGEFWALTKHRQPLHRLQ